MIISGKAFEIISAGQFEFYADMNYKRKNNAGYDYIIMNTIDFIMFKKGTASSNYRDLGENGEYESTYLWSSSESKLAYSKITGNNFSGKIDGNSQEFINIQSVDGILPLASGVTISNLTIKDASLDQKAGTTSMTESGILFGTLSGDSKIDNLTFKNITVNSKGNNVGLIIGQNNTTLTITNMKIDSDADADVSKVNTLTSTYTKGAYVGGIIGQSNGAIAISGSDAYEMTVNLPSNSTFGNLVGKANGNVTSDFNNTLDYNTFNYTYVFTSDKTITMGGLVGELVGGEIATTTETLKTNNLGSYNDGTNTYIAKYVGGIVGKLTDGTINYIPIKANIELTGCTTGAIAGYMSGGTIDYDDNNTNAITLEGYTIGGVVGEMTGGTISNIIVNKVTFDNFGEGYNFVTFGGAVGKISGASTCTIKNVTVNANNNNNSNIYSSLQEGKTYYFGGLIGIITKGTIDITSTTNKWSITNPTVTEGETLSFYVAIGGFVGQIQNGTITISGSTNTADIGNDKVQYASGFIAYVGMEEENSSVNLKLTGLSKNEGAITTITQNSDVDKIIGLAGGFIGYINSSATINIDGTIKNTAAIIGINAGGLIGRMKSGSINTILEGSISNSGIISGVDYAGGLFGYINATINIQKATNSGAVNVTSESGSLGGIFGYLTSTSISITNNISNSASAHIGSNGNGMNVGGIIGQLKFTGKDKNFATITATNSGEIGTSALLNGVPISTQLYLGGIIGYVTSETKNVAGTTVGTGSNIDNIVLVIKDSSNTGTVHGKPSEITAENLLNGQDSVENKADVLKDIVDAEGHGAFSGGIVGYGEKIGISGSKNNGYIGRGNEAGDHEGTTVGAAGQNNSGGIAGKINDSTIYNSHNANVTKIVIGGGTSKEFVSAGIVAYATGGSLIESCTNSAKYIDGTMDGGIVAVLENSTVNNCHNFGQAGIAGDSFAGGIAALVIHSTIDGSTNSGAIHDARVSGGIAAVLDDLDDSRNGSQIKNSTNSASVNVIGGLNDGYLGYTMAGGIVAFMKAETIYNNGTATANISESNTTGTNFVVGNDTSNPLAKTYVAGGVVGYLLSGSIQGGNAEGPVEVSGATVTGYYAGGVVGYVSPTNDMEISYITNKNTVNGANNSYKDDSYGAIGGIVGYIGSILGEEASNNTNLVSIIGCDNQATIGSAVNIRPNAGGIVGQVGEKEMANSTHYASVYIENCKNEHAIYGRFTGGILGRGYVNTNREDKTIIKNATNSNQVYGYKGDAGGIVGILQVKQAENQATQAEIIAVDIGTNYGQISTDTDASTNRSLGGIAGYIENASIKGSDNESNQSWTGLSAKNINSGGIVGHINNGNIEDSTNNKNITADIDIGGIVGKTSGGNVNIINCTQNGAVTGDNKVGGIVCVVGSTETEINNCTMNGNITAGAGAGGIVCDATSGSITISGCTYTGGNVTVKGNALATGLRNYAGGIIGYTNQTLTINNTTANVSTVEVEKGEGFIFAGGIVGCASGGGSIENVTVKNGIIISAPTSIMLSRAGGVAGYLRDFGKLDTSTNSINGFNIRGTGFNVTGYTAGGIAGQLHECIVPLSDIHQEEDYGFAATVKGVSVAGLIVGQISGGDGSDLYFGGDGNGRKMTYNGSVEANYVGLVGEVAQPTQIRFLSANNNTSYDVRMDGLTLLGDVAAGYIVGRNSNKLTMGADNTIYDINIYAGTNLEAKYAGGIVGYNASDLNVKSLNIENFKTHNSNATYVGGIIAYSSGDTDISYCNVTNVTLDARGGVGSGEVPTVGGIVGKNTALLKVQYCNVSGEKTIIQSSYRQEAEALYALGGTKHNIFTYPHSHITGVDGVSSVNANGYQYVGSKKIGPGAYIGGIVGYYTNARISDKKFGTISNNTISNITLSHNISTKSNESSIDSIYPVGGKFIGYATSFPHQFSGNSGSTKNSLSHTDNFKIFSAMYNVIPIPLALGIEWISYSYLYYVKQTRSYFSTEFSIGRIGEEKGQTVYNGNAFSWKLNDAKMDGSLNAVFNNYSYEEHTPGIGAIEVANPQINLKKITQEDCGYCYITELSDNGYVVRQKMKKDDSQCSGWYWIWDDPNYKYKIIDIKKY